MTKNKAHSFRMDPIIHVLATNQVRSMCQRGFGPDHQLASVNEIGGGTFNTAYRIAFTDGLQVILPVGTGGTSGAGYLEGMLNQHYAFREITEVATFLIERSQRLLLPNALKTKASFTV